MRCFTPHFFIIFIMYTKYNFLLISIILLLPLNLFSQQKTQYTIIDKYNNPISDVIIYNNNDIIAITDDSGEFNINENINTILCHRLGCIDTILQLNNYSKNKIVFNACSFDLVPVSVKGKYNAKKHLKKLRNISKEKFDAIDTVIFYKFKIKIDVIENNQNELFSGIIKVPYNGNSGVLFWQEAFYCRFDDYKNNISKSVYTNIPANRIAILLNGNLLFNRNQWRNIKKRKINSQINTNDSLVFRAYEINRKDFLDGYIGFNNNILNYVEYIYKLDNPKLQGNDKYCLFSIYYKMKYSNYDKKRLYPISIYTLRKYILKGGKTINYSVEINAVKKCKCEFDSIKNNKVMIIWNNEKSIEYLKEQLKIIKDMKNN